MNLSRQNRARLAWAQSFFKPRWRFEDYPVDYIDQGECALNLPERLQHKRWRVDLINWYEVSGVGESKEAALADAKHKFGLLNASGEKMCRPGIGPGSAFPKNPAIVFPENQEIDSYPELRDDFICRVLGLEWAWVTDGSSLWDFHSSEDNSEMYLRIGEVYGVDVSDVPNANLTGIFAKIMNQIGTFPEDASVRAVRLARDARDRQLAGLPALPWQ
jgi:hypothetical protein